MKSPFRVTSTQVRTSVENVFFSDFTSKVIFKVDFGFSFFFDGFFWLCSVPVRIKVESEPNFCSAKKINTNELFAVEIIREIKESNNTVWIHLRNFILMPLFADEIQHKELTRKTGVWNFFRVEYFGWLFHFIQRTCSGIEGLQIYIPVFSEKCFRESYVREYETDATGCTSDILLLKMQDMFTFKEL